MPREAPLWYREDRPLRPAEVQLVVRQSVKKLAGGPDKQFQVQSVVFLNAVQTNFGSAISSTFLEINRSTYEQFANAYVNRLFRAGILDSFFIEGKPMIQASVPGSKWQALTDDSQIDSFEYVQIIESVEDKVLADRIVSMIATGVHADSAVREAVTIVEDRLRDAAGLGKEHTPKRTDLSGKAFNTQNGRMVYSEDPAIQEGVMSLFKGYFLAIANDSHHELGDYEWRDVARIVILSDHLLSIVDRSSRRTT